jgi:hypothetical protein
MVECSGCNSWLRYEAEITEGMWCPECEAPLEPARSRRCLEPLGFRTDFRPKDRDPGEEASGRHRSIHAEHRPLSLSPSPETNVSVAVVPGGRTYRVNRGRYDEDAEAWPGYSVLERVARIRYGKRNIDLTGQWIQEPVGDPGFEALLATGLGAETDFWLAAPKTTDLVAVAPSSVASGLAIHRLLGERSLEGRLGTALLEAMQATAVRAAAISAAFILAGRAALYLDVDPEEFDIIEPRIAQPSGIPVPVLQFADRLVNGAGLCSTLGQSDPVSGENAIGKLVKSIVDDSGEYPLRTFDQPDHRADCERACYRCLLRHSNQTYHGLLDWRLGLAFIGTLRDPAFRCGLDGTFDHASITDWKVLVERAIDRFKSRLPSAEMLDLDSTFAVRVRPTTPWGVVVHPLWDPGAALGSFESRREELGGQFRVVDSFNLDRRPWKVRDGLES